MDKTKKRDPDMVTNIFEDLLTLDMERIEFLHDSQEYHKSAEIQEAIAALIEMGAE